MISNSLGAMPRGVDASLREYATTWATRGVRAWAERWWTMAQGSGRRDCAAHRRAGGDDWHVRERHRRAHVGVVDAAPTRHPRCHRVFGRRLSVDDLSVPRTGGAGLPPRGRSCQRRRQRGRRRALPTPSTTARRWSPYRTCCSARRSSSTRRPSWSKPRRVGAPVMLDLYQAAGIIPVDVRALGVDFAAGGCLKWLCGGPGNAFLYTRPDRLSTVRPRFTGWASHPQPFAFDARGLPGARRPSTDADRHAARFPPITRRCLGSACSTAIGIDTVRVASLQLTRRLLDLVDHHGFRTVASRDPGGWPAPSPSTCRRPAHVARTLNAHDIVVDYRPGVGIRVAPHVYNTVGEVEAALGAMAEIVRTKALRAGGEPARNCGDLGDWYADFCNFHCRQFLMPIPRAIPTQTVRLCRLGTRL